uniref:Expansin n=1 Tax=Micrasterias denticulata TaxID=407018 RepID=G4V4D3_9VIRI|nr:expansin [Micrasterias denticulata]
MKIGIIHALSLLLTSPVIVFVHGAIPTRDGLGTLSGVEKGGSCGFANNFPAPGVFTAGVSAAIYGNGAACGACFVATCANSPQCTANRVFFTVTNQCLGENSTSPCVTGRSGVALQPQAFDVIATSRAPGIVPVKFTQVPCRTAGGVQFVVQSGNQYYFAVLIQNVGGPGSLQAVAVSTNGRTFQLMTRSYGAVWQVSNFDIRRASLHFRLTGNDGQQLTILNALPANWVAKRIYSSLTNFALVRRTTPERILVAAKIPARRVPAVLGPSHFAMATLGQAGGQNKAGGACGFANYPSVATLQAGLSETLYRNGAFCGSCLRVACVNSPQCIPGTVTVQVTNLCTASNASAAMSVCVDGNPAVNLQPEAWDKIVKSRSPGVASVLFQQISCASPAQGVQFQVRDANPTYFSVLVQNVGGIGALTGVEVAFGGGGKWTAMARSLWRCVGR